ncbi:MobC family plasmid mobilization relaxosome protein [Butyrivibrio sp. AC2005]|uniref:MobC family plasmid mobilization relaxosome protein n=1 Tax=Butyrivibrio sp. AC2005 TaxID=1280672 RepID=UPI0003FE5510|nr:MobC family plasmid mobilization relaxosome protein [Butyrivibrio sp. AC2005]
MKKIKEEDRRNTDKYLHVRLSENELKRLRNLANDFEMSVSEFVRWSIFQRQVTMRILIDDETNALTKIKYQLGRIGNNINQIAKLINTGYVNPEMFRNELNDMCNIIHNEVCLLNDVQSATHNSWRKAISKYSKYYQIDRTDCGIKE